MAKEYIEHTCGECIHSEVCEHLPTLTGWDALNTVYCRAFKNAADVVEVVRCKDCKHRGMDECPMHIKGTPPDEYWLVKFDNDFCSYGERKSDG